MYSMTGAPRFEQRRSDVIQGVEVRLDARVEWPEWRTWLRPLVDEGLLRPYGVHLEKMHRIKVVSLDGALPRISGVTEANRLQQHFLLSCEMERDFVLCLPLTIVRELDVGPMLADCGPDEGMTWSPLFSAEPARWQSTFEVFVHITVAELVRAFELTLEERRDLYVLLEPKLHPWHIARIAPALEYRN